MATERQECVLALLAYGGYDPNCRTKGGMTPSHLAACVCVCTHAYVCDWIYKN